jgi:hypothetical protein
MINATQMMIVDLANAPMLIQEGFIENAQA